MSPPTTRFPTVLRALRHRNFRLFFSGQLVSLIGTWMQMLAQSWLVYRLTGSAALLGLAGFCGQIPVLFFATIGGTVADHYNRRHVVIATQVAAMILAGILAALTLGGWVRVWHIFVLAFLLGVVNAFDMPARQAFVVEMVGREDLMNAIALNSSMFNGARMLGPAVAGTLVAAIGEGWCFFANAVSYIAVIAGLLMMKVVPRAMSESSGSTLRRLGDGLHYVALTGPVRTLLLLLGLVSLTGMPYVTLMPIFAGEILHGGSPALGALMSSVGAGALLGALSLAARRGLRGLGRWVGFAAALFGIALILFSFSRSLWLSMALLLPVGFGMMVQMASSNTLIQSMIPDHLRGRVMAVYLMMFMGMAPFGALWAGFAAEKLGAPLTVALGGIASLVGAGVFLWHLPAWRPEARRLVQAQQRGEAAAPNAAPGARTDSDPAHSSAQ